MDTVLALPIAEAEPVVSHLRAMHDSSAAAGLPAHITVLYPFLPFEEIDEECLDALQDIMSATAPMDITFRGHSRFPTFLWLAPEPAEPIIDLTEAVVARFPDYPPYGGAFDTIIPHLAVAEGDADVLNTAAEEMDEALGEPLKATVGHCVLFALDQGRWQEKHSFPFGGRRS